MNVISRNLLLEKNIFLRKNDVVKLKKSFIINDEFFKPFSHSIGVVIRDQFCSVEEYLVNILWNDANDMEILGALWTVTNLKKINP